jgi:peptide/nickel transport system substrate-binding protein
MMRRALELSLEDSLFIWTIDQQSYSPYSADVQVTADLALGYEATSVGAHNLRFKDQEGGVMKIGTNDLFTQPWNTVAGSNWVWDSAVHRFKPGYFRHCWRRWFDGRSIYGSRVS